MMKRVFALMLAVLMLCALVACSGDEDDGITSDPVIDVEIKLPTYTDSNGDTFTYEYLNSTSVKITGFSGSDEPHLVTIPAYVVEKVTVDGDQTEEVQKKVAAIDDSAFFANSNISDIKCEAELISIGRYAFAYCEALLTVELPDSLENIGDGAFYNCSALTSVDLGTGVKEIGNHVFANCASLSAITFPSSLERIGAYTFAECVALTAVELPEGIVSVGAQAFYNCTAVEKLTLPASLIEIGDWAFNPFVRTLPDEAVTVVEGSKAAEYIAQVRP